MSFLRVIGITVMSLLALLSAVYFFVLSPVYAQNIFDYKNTISDSAPTYPSNHTFSFRLEATLNPSGVIEIVPPAGFSIIDSDRFSPEKNVELIVNGSSRISDVFQSNTTDRVEIATGTPGLIRYTLNTTSGIASGSNLVFKIGGHTSQSLTEGYEIFDELASTTTIVLADQSPVINAPEKGTYKFHLSARNGMTEVARAGFLIALVDRVTAGPADTTEEIPPSRFNGQPSGIVSATSLFAEVSLETDEFANCRYSLNPGVSYNSMINQFANPGSVYWIFHTAVVPIIPDSIATFYVKCIDDEKNVNIDDYIITFQVDPSPSGESNVDGSIQGDGTGSGNEGGGDGSGSGGQTGDSSGEAPTLGGSAGTGGSGGGGGGGAGGGTGSGAGGGFETSDGPYPSGDGRVIISGYAIPRAKVSAVVDGKLASEVTADASGRYEITIDAISRGSYTFGVYATDSAGVKTSTYSTSFSVSGGRASNLSNINVPPSIKVIPNPVVPGQPFTFSGFSLPNAEVTLDYEQDKNTASRRTLTITSSQTGAWSISVEGNQLQNGTYKVRARAEQTNGQKTNYSNYTFFGVGQAADVPRSSDLNRDGKVNLVDFSIMLFWWNTDGGTSNPSADINGDKRVNLTDFSILLFNWTG